MANIQTTQRRPRITLGRSEHEKLTRLAEAFADRNGAASEALLGELDRARVISDVRLPVDVVRMGSTLRYATETGDVRTVTLVYPGEADIAAGKVSVLTPIGAALIGLSVGQSIDWIARDGRRHGLTVEAVEPMAESEGLRARAS